MGEVESNDDAVCLCCSSDSLDIEQLTREKVHTGEDHHCELIGMLLDQIDNVFCSNYKLVLTRSRENKRVFWIEPMMHDLRFYRIGVGRERWLFHQDFETRFGRPIKRRHHQMKVHRETVHVDHLQGVRADKARGRFAQSFAQLSNSSSTIARAAFGIRPNELPAK